MFARGGDGSDTLIGGAGPDDFDGGADDDPTIVGGGGADALTGGDGVDLLDGGADADVTINGEAGNDTILGGPGNDREVIGGQGDDRVDGGDGNDDVTGYLGDDTIVGGAGDDRVDFHPVFSADPSGGADSLDGGPGNDMLNGGPSPTVANASEQGGLLASDKLLGGDGTDTADFSQRTAPLTIDLDGNADDGEDGEHDNVQSDVEHLIGGSDADILRGTSAANILDGRDGEDRIEGRGGDDTLLGGANDPSGDHLSGEGGNDTMRGESGDDALEGGMGDDNESGGGGGDRVEGHAGNDWLAGGPGADTVEGGEGHDKLNGADLIIVGGDGPDELIGGPGADDLRGGAGKDLLDGGSESDYIDGQGETDTVTYEDRANKVFVTLDGRDNDGERDEHDNVVNVEKILGGLLGDDLSGDPGDNTIAGERGQDLIDGKLGPDRLLGGAAADVVMARDGVADDVVACGSGKDLAVADDADRVIECDTVDRPSTHRAVAGRYALVRPRGTFGLRLPKGPRFFPLAAEVKIPIRSTIDPKARVLRLATARNRTGARRIASVSAGRFTLRQGTGRRAVTKLRLADKVPNCQGSSTGRRDAKQLARTSTRRLRVDVRGIDGRGSRRGGRWWVRGRYSVGGSYGTEWITEDTCEGTLTNVISGTVQVRDLVRGKTVKVHAGDSYLAAPR